MCSFLPCAQAYEVRLLGIKRWRWATGRVRAARAAGSPRRGSRGGAGNPLGFDAASGVAKPRGQTAAPNRSGLGGSWREHPRRPFRSRPAERGRGSTPRRGDGGPRSRRAVRPCGSRDDDRQFAAGHHGSPPLPAYRAQRAVRPRCRGRRRPQPGPGHSTTTELLSWLFWRGRSTAAGPASTWRTHGLPAVATPRAFRRGALRPQHPDLPARRARNATLVAYLPEVHDHQKAERRRAPRRRWPPRRAFWACFAGEPRPR